MKEEYRIYEEKMRKTLDSLQGDFASVRAGRANALDRVLTRSVWNITARPPRSTRSAASPLPIPGRW